MTRPLIKKWRSEGKQVLMYLDDGLGSHSDKQQCYKISCEVKQDLISSGFVPKVEKSMLLPCQQVVYLGYFIDIQNGIVKIPQERLEKAKNVISEIEMSVHNLGEVHVRTVASFVGQIISMAYVLGNIVYIMTKSLSIDILKANSWNCNITLTGCSLDQIQFWKENIEDVNVKSLRSDLSCNTFVYSDASGSGYGGYIVENPSGIAHGMWSDDEKTQSSTWRELAAVDRVLVSLKTFLKGKCIKWFTDNKKVVSIVEKGSMKRDLQNIALRIFKICLATNTSLHLEWVPRTENEKADQISKYIDYDDWAYRSRFS